MNQFSSKPVRLGITYVPAYSPEGLREAVRVAESAGLDDFWLWEDCFAHGGLATAAVALASSSHIRVGIGLLPIPLRNVAVTAMEFATLDRMFPGRVLAGIGHGVQGFMSQCGARVASPMTLLAEYHSVLRDLLDGRRVTFHGAHVHLDDVQLRWPPEVRMPLLLGGVGPKSLRFAARSADGTLLTAALGEDEIDAVCGLIRDERRAESLLGAGHDICAILITATGPGAEDRLRGEVGRWNKADTPRVGVAGDADTIARAIDRLAAFGVNVVAIQPTDDEPDLLDFIRFLGTQVKPLLRQRSE